MADRISYGPNRVPMVSGMNCLSHHKMFQKQSGRRNHEDTKSQIFTKEFPSVLCISPGFFSSRLREKSGFSGIAGILRGAGS
jgi:hypothetical protein